MLISTDRTERTSSWSATAATGRLAASSTSTVTRARSGNSAPRQRRGRNGLIGVSAKQRRADRDDRALGRKIVGGRSGRRRQQDAVGDELGEPLLAVDQNAQPRRLIGLAEQRHLVDGAVAVDRPAASRARISSGWMTVTWAAASRSLRPCSRNTRSSESRRCRGACRRSACRNS